VNTAAQVEPAIRPEAPIIDAHIHLWHRDNFFVQDYLTEIKQSGYDVEASIYVECGMSYSDDPRVEFRSLGEMAYVLGQAKQAEGSGHALAAGIMGAADLTLGSRVKPILEALAAAANGRLVGIRYRVAMDPDPIAGFGGERGYPSHDVLDHPEFLEGVRCLAGMGLHLETWGFHTQLTAIARLAAQAPDLKIVINHCGGPLGVGRYAGRREEVYKDWRDGIKVVAKSPNVLVKVSGLAIPRMGFGFQEKGQIETSDELARLWRPYVRTCVEEFGPSRSIFASNYPIERTAAPYGKLVNAYRKILQDLSEDEFRAVFSESARGLYRL
jgi:L-fuconolactonase